jgi:hypothetical protein
MNVDGKREPIRAAGDEFAAGGITISPGELLHAIDQTPELFSPNVLLRAIVQDTLLPTVAYIGGPAEIAYMAQVEVVYGKLMNRMPAILPRPGFTLVLPHVARLLKKYGLSLSDILQGRQRLAAILAAGSLTKGLARRFERDEKTLQKALKGLEKPLELLDKSLLIRYRITGRALQAHRIASRTPYPVSLNHNFRVTEFHQPVRFSVLRVKMPPFKQAHFDLGRKFNEGHCRKAKRNASRVQRARRDCRRRDGSARLT